MWVVFLIALVFKGVDSEEVVSWGGVGPVRGVCFVGWGVRELCGGGGCVFF